MTQETTNTSQYQLTPEGSYHFTVKSSPVKKRTQSGKSSYRIWELEYVANESKKTCRILLFPWESEELLLALGGEEIGPHQIRWDDEQVVGRSFTAEIVHREDNQGTLREKLENVEGGAWDE